MGEQELALRGRRRGQRAHDEHRPLALAQVVARRLAGDLRVAEDAEHVVAELERLAHGQAERARRGDRVVVGAGERGAERDGVLDAVARGLRTDDGPGALLVGRRVLAPRQDLCVHVEVLAGRDLRLHAAEHASRPRGDRGLEVVERVAELPVARDEREVAEQDRGVLAVPRAVAGPAEVAVARREGAVRRRAAAPGVRGVHDVVVEERRRLEQLERRAGAQRRGPVRACGVTAVRARHDQ